jgi:hypothetical protein
LGFFPGKMHRSRRTRSEERPDYETLTGDFDELIGAVEAEKLAKVTAFKNFFSRKKEKSPGPRTKPIPQKITELATGEPKGVLEMNQKGDWSFKEADELGEKEYEIHLQRRKMNETDKEGMLEVDERGDCKFTEPDKYGFEKTYEILLGNRKKKPDSSYSIATDTEKDFTEKHLVNASIHNTHYEEIVKDFDKTPDIIMVCENCDRQFHQKIALLTHRKTCRGNLENGTDSDMKKIVKSLHQQNELLRTQLQKQQEVQENTNKILEDILRQQQSRNSSKTTSTNSSKVQSRMQSRCSRQISPERRTQMKTVEVLTEAKSKLEAVKQDVSENKTALSYDITPNLIVDEKTISYWLDARESASLCADAENPAIRTMQDLQSKKNSRILDNAPTLLEGNRLQYQQFLATMRTFMIQMNIDKTLIVEVTKLKIYPSLRDYLQQCVQQRTLRTEADLLKLLANHLYAGYSYSTLRTRFEEINSDRKEKGVAIVATFRDIQSSQANILADIHPTKPSNAVERNLLVKLLTYDLLTSCLSETDIRYLGLQGLLDQPDINLLVSSQAKIDLYSGKQKQKQLSAITESKKTAIDEIESLTTTQNKTTMPKQNETKIQELERLLKTKDKLLASKNEQIKKIAKFDNQKKTDERGEATATATKKWKPRHIAIRQCRVCKTEPENMDPCGHCRSHSTKGNLIDFRMCPDEICQQKRAEFRNRNDKNSEKEE